MSVFHRTFLITLATLVGGLFCLSQPVFAAPQINNQINYQAKLMDASGFPVADGTYAIKFSLYDAVSAGTRLWSASGTTATPVAMNVTVQNGLFSILLGDTSAAGGSQNTLDTVDWNSDSLYLGITIAADAEMLPRKRFASAPQAFNSRQLQGMYASSTASGGQTLFTINQTQANAATGTRASLDVRTNGTSNANDFLIRGLDNTNTAVFSVNRLGNATTSFLNASNVFVSGLTTSTSLYANAASFATTTVTGSLNAFGSMSYTASTSTSPFTIRVPSTTSTGSPYLVSGLTFSSTNTRNGINMFRFNSSGSDFSGISYTNDVVNALSATGSLVYFDHNLDVFNINLLSGAGVATPPVKFQMHNLDNPSDTGAVSAFELDSNSNNSSTALLYLSAGGAGAQMSLHVSTSSPEGKVYATIGSVLFNSLGTSSGTQAYLKTANGVTGWKGIATVDMLSGGGGGNTSDSNWLFDLSGDFVRNATPTTDVVIGSSTERGAPFVFVTNTTSSRLMIGQSTSTGVRGDVVIGSTTSSNMNSLFQLTGQDLFVAGNIGSASSVYTNGEFIAGNASTHYGDGYINKDNGALTVEAASHVIIASTGGGKIFLNADTVNIGSTTVPQIINLNGYISTDYIQSANNLYDLGSSVTSVRNIYASGTIRSVSGVYSNLFASNASATTFIATSGTMTTLNSNQSNISNLTVFNDETVQGTSTINGNVYLGNNSSQDRVVFTSTIDSHLNPTSNNTYSLGQLGQAWKGYFTNVTTTDFEAAGNVILNGTTIAAYNEFTTDIVPHANATYSLGTQFQRWNGYLQNATTTNLRVESGIDLSVGSNSVLSLVASSSVIGIGESHVVVAGNMVYVSVGASSSLSVFEHTSAGTLTFVTTTVLSNAPTKLQIDGNSLVALSSSGLDLYDISNPFSPRRMVQIPATNLVDFKIVGGFIYATFLTGDKLRVINQTSGAVSSIAGPEALGSIDVQGSVAVVGALGSNNVYIYDVQNPANPTQLSVYDAGATPIRIQISGSHAYIGRTATTLGRVINLTNLASPTLDGTFSCSPLACNSFIKSGRYLYTQGRSAFLSPTGVAIQDASNPAAIGALAYQEYGKRTYDFAISGKYLYATVSDNLIGTATSSLYVVDVSGMEVNGLIAHSAQLGDLQTVGQSTFVGPVTMQGGLAIGGNGLFSEGPIEVRASSTSATVSLVNIGSTNPAGTNWAAYIKNLLVGGNANASGTQNYSMVLTYASSSSVGGICIDDTSTAAGCPTGSVIGGASLLADGAIIANAFDIAETYDTTGTTSPGDVLVLDTSSTATVKQSIGVAYDSKVIGVVSTAPGFQLGWSGGSRVALAGRVPVKISMNNGDIHVGDALVSSDVPGLAMKATQPGMILGYALEDITATGTAQMFVSVGFWAGLAIGPGGSIQLDASGNVSILHDLHVGGKLFPSLKGGGIQNDWYLFVDDTDASSTYISTNASGFQSLDTYDFAERYYSPDELDSGDLVIVSDTGKTHVQRSMNASQMLLGIVSTRPAFIAGRPATSTYPIALSGRVPTKVSTMNGSIKAGDPIGPTTIPGVAAKAIHTGPIVGLALEDYDGTDISKIEVFVNPGWWTNVAETNQQTIINTTVVQSTPTTIIRRGVGMIASGSKRVHVTYASIGAYPFVQVTPRGLIQGNWGTDGYTDTGFDIILSQEQSFDTYFSWQVEPLQGSDRLNSSDGTSADIDTVTGLPIGVAATSTMEIVSEQTVSETTSTVSAASE